MKADEMRRYRETHPEYKARDRDLLTARKRAWRQLEAAHPAEFTILLDTICAEMGIDPPGSRPTGRPTGGGR